VQSVVLFESCAARCPGLKKTVKNLLSTIMGCCCPPIIIILKHFQINLTNLKFYDKFIKVEPVIKIAKFFAEHTTVSKELAQDS
jgi:hypothetical protein